MGVDIKCPICNKKQKGLNLEETDGMFICSNCQSEIQVEIQKDKIINLKIKVNRKTDKDKTR